MSAKNGSSLTLKLVVLVVVVAVAGVFAYRYLGTTAVVEPVRRGKAVDVVTGSVNVNADGGIRPLKSEIAGRVLACDALGEDKTFKKDDVLVQLDDSDIRRAMKTAENDFNAATERAKLARDKDPALNLAKDQLENITRLHARGERSDKELEAAKLAVDRINTALELADLDAKKAKADFAAAKELSERMLEKTKIRAPFDGSVQVPQTFAGALIGAGDTLALILSNARVVTAKVSEDAIAKVKLDQDAKVSLLSFPGEQFEAKVIRISETADEVQRFNVFLEVKTDLARLKHGATGEARITVGVRENQPLVPRRAVFNDDQLYVVKNGVIEQRKVEVGYKALNYVEVRAGVQPGELVVVEDIDRLAPGQRVRLPAALMTPAP